MIDLTNKNIDELKEKYSLVLETIIYREQIPYMAYILDVAINYIKENYQVVFIDWKCWVSLLLYKLQLKNKINSDEDIKNIIDEFFNYVHTDYEKYVNNLAMYATEWDRDYGFIFKFMKKFN